MPAYDRRGMQGQGLLFATANRGACHMRGNMLGSEVLGLPKLIDRLQVRAKRVFVILHQHSAAIVDSLVLCKFANIAVAEEYFARALTALTGESSIPPASCCGSASASGTPSASSIWRTASRATTIRCHAVCAKSRSQRGRPPVTS